MIVGDRKNSESVIEHQISDVEAEARDGRPPKLKVRRNVLDDRTGSRPLGDHAENLVDCFQELAAEPWSLFIEPDGGDIEFLLRLSGELGR